MPRGVSAVEPLDIAQGGFRKNRGTQESIASLNEAIIQFEKENRGRSPVIAFLDIKAAYDSVDPVLLFNALESTDIDPNVGRTIRELFMGVRSHVTVGGVESREFPHQAGVLQGAILSPVLYSLAINSIAAKLREVRPDPRTVFMYADDLAFIADNEEQMATILQAAEDHSYQYNYRFNANKCEMMNAREGVLRIYEQPMPICETFKYLGCIFDIKGIRWDLHFERLEDKTDKVLHLFRSIGFNGPGFRERTKITIMKAFIRSTYEYCLAIMPKVQMWLEALESLQHKCLITMLGVNRNTSKAAIEALTGIVDIERRHHELSARFCYSVESRTSSFMTTIVRQKSRTFLKRRSCFAQCENHPLLIEHEVLKNAHEQRRRELQENQEVVMIQEKKWTLDKTILLTRSRYLETVRNTTTRLKYLPIYDDSKPRMWYALGRLPKSDARICILWTLGKLPGKPRRCTRCRTTRVYSASHFMECTNCLDVDEHISDGRWERMASTVKEMTRRMDGLEYLSEGSNYRRLVQRIRLDNGRRFSPVRAANGRRYFTRTERHTRYARVGGLAA